MKIVNVLTVFFLFQLAMFIAVSSQMPSKKVIREGLHNLAR